MGCGGCGAKTPRNNPFDKRGNSLDNYAFLNPNQLAIKRALEAQEEEEQEQEDE